MWYIPIAVAFNMTGRPVYSRRFWRQMGSETSNRLVRSLTVFRLSPLFQVR